MKPNLLTVDIAEGEGVTTLAANLAAVERIDIDNSSAEPEPMATKGDGRLIWHRRPSAPLRAELAAAGVEDLPPVRASAKSRR